MIWVAVAGGSMMHDEVPNGYLVPVVSSIERLDYAQMVPREQ